MIRYNLIHRIPRGTIIRGRISYNILPGQSDPVGPLDNYMLLWDCNYSDTNRWLINNQAEYEELI